MLFLINQEKGGFSSLFGGGARSPERGERREGQGKDHTPSSSLDPLQSLCLHRPVQRSLGRGVSWGAAPHREHEVGNGGPPRGPLRRKPSPPKTHPWRVWGPWASQHVWNRGSSHLKILHRGRLPSWALGTPRAPDTWSAERQPHGGRNLTPGPGWARKAWAPGRSGAPDALSPFLGAQVSSEAAGRGPWAQVPLSGRCPRLLVSAERALSGCRGRGRPQRPWP